MITSSLDGVQVPLLIVQRKVLAPAPKPVTVLVGLPGVVIVPVPLTSVQAPVPATGVFPAKAATNPHTVWSGPATDTLGVAV